MGSVRTLVVMLAVSLALAKAFNISEFKNIAPGLEDDWKKAGSDNLRLDNEYFGLAYGGDKLYVVSRHPARDRPDDADGSATRGGVVSVLINGTWTTKSYDRLEQDETMVEKLFVLRGRLYMLTANVTSDAITFGHLFKWDDVAGKWINVDMIVHDNATQSLTRGPHYALSHLVPDPTGDVVYVLATDHELNTNDSESTVMALNINGDGERATLSEISEKLRGKFGTAATSMVVRRTKSDLDDSIKRDDILYLIYSDFVKSFNNSDLGVKFNNTVAYAYIGYMLDIDGRTGMATAVPVDEPESPKPYVDFSHDRTFQLGDYLLMLGPHEDRKDSNGAVIDQARHLWLVPVDKMIGSAMAWQETDGAFPNTPKNVFAVDAKNMGIYTAGLKAGAFVATIIPDRLSDPIVGQPNLNDTAVSPQSSGNSSDVPPSAGPGDFANHLP
jgi:hypothetical protein